MYPEVSLGLCLCCLVGLLRWAPVVQTAGLCVAHRIFCARLHMSHSHVAFIAPCACMLLVRERDRCI